MVLTLLVVSVVGWFRPYHGAIVASASVLAPASATVAGAAAKKASQPDPLLKPARLGNEAAIKAIAARAPSELDAEHWAALGRGRARNRDWLGVLDAYGHALEKSPTLVADGELLNDIRSAALDSVASQNALKFAAKRLRATGADIIYDVWSSAASGRASQADVTTARRLLDDTGLRSTASKALRIALELNDARGCADYRRLLPRVSSEGDERCLRVLRRLSYDRGCGLFKLGDCYSCLRGNNGLAQAIESAKIRPSPTFR